MVAAFVLSQLAALPDALLALWLMLLGKGVLERRSGLVLTAAVGLGLSAAATWFLRTVGTRVQRRFRDKVTIALESHVARLQATVATIAHQERPDYLDLLDMLRNQVFVLDHMYMSVFSTCSWILRLVVTIALLMSIHPALILLAVFAIPTAFTATWRPGIERKVQERSAQSHRRARHLFTVATTAAPAKEVRIAGIGPSLDDRAASRLGARVSSDRRRPLALGDVAHAGLGGVRRRVCGRGGLRLVGPAGSGEQCASRPGRRRPVVRVHRRDGRRDRLPHWLLDVRARRLAWLEDYAAAMAASADLPVPGRISRGIRFDHVSFVYPGTDRLVLDDVNLMLPAGSVVAIVGENGAGKTTLVKLLAKMYEPRSGSILIDDTPLARVPADQWRARLAGAFQDFFRFEFRARQTIGVGDVPRLDDAPAVMAAVGRAGADEVVVKLKAGLDTQLGPTWPNGVDVSFGQWQKLALARGFMRDGPLLLVLDEPTAALDAETEHALFERYAAAVAAEGRSFRTGRIRRGPATDASRFSCRTDSRPCAWPI